MKNDYLKECMSDIVSVIKKPVPINDFNNEFCKYCSNKECSRAGILTSLFHTRVNSWQQRFFIDPPRATDQDPKFESIRAKWFKPEIINSNIPVQESLTTEEPKDSNNIGTSMEPTIEGGERQASAPDNASSTLQNTPEDLNADKLEMNQVYRSTNKPAANTAFDIPRYVGNKPVVEESKSETKIESGGTFTFGD